MSAPQTLTLAPKGFADIQELVADDMRAVNATIERRLHSGVALVNQVSKYIIHSGGKRLRPMLVLLSARAHGYQGPDHITLAAVIEFIHTATLLHDDVVDASELRRGRETVNAVWGNETSVLVGDFLYSRAFQMMVEINRGRVMELLADTTNLIAEGEVMQLLNCHDPDTTESRYLEVIKAKTAKLFEAAARLGPVLAGGSSETHMADYGMAFGTAYQLVDDLLDYGGAAQDIGKNIGDDLSEGKPTLPLIYAIREGDRKQRELVRDAVRRGGLERIDEVIAAVESTGAITYTARAARAEADKATASLNKVPPSLYRDALEMLVEFAVERNF